MVFILFDFFLNIPINNISVMSAHPERGWQMVLTPSLENRKPLGLFSNTGPDPLGNQVTKPAFNMYWEIIAPPAFC